MSGDRKHPLRLLVTLTAVAAFLGASAQAQQKASRPGVYEGYATAAYDGSQRSSFYVTARDGTRLAVDLFRPTRGGVVASEKLPVVWMHTPYNRRTYAGGPTVERYPGFALQLVKYGYNVAVVDFRGLYASFGQNKGYNRGEWRDPAHYDAYDVTEWFARQDWSNGRVGMWGCSATGGSQMQAATTRPPSLKAIMPMSAEFDAYPFAALGGVSRGPVGAPNQGPGDPNAARDAQAVAVDGPDGADLLAQAIAEHRSNADSPGLLPFRDSVSSVVGAPWWVKSSPSTWLADLKASGIGVYAVANWDEAGTRHGAFFNFRNLGETQAKLLVGPATHCAWTAVKEQTGFQIVTEELRFYDYWLKGVKNGVMNEPAVTYFTYNAPADKAWRKAKAWPLPNEARTDYYLGHGSLDRTKPAGAGRDEVAMSTPAPAAATQINSPAGGWNYETAPFTADLEVTGHPVMHLWVETGAGDADVMARLEDVAPDGKAVSYQMIGRLRASHRALAQAPYDTMGLPWHTYRQADAQPLAAGQPAELTFDLLPMSYIFKAGHRLRLNITFTDPQTRPNAPGVTVLRSVAAPSRLTLPVIPAR